MGVALGINQIALDGHPHIRIHAAEPGNHYRRTEQARQFVFEVEETKAGRFARGKLGDKIDIAIRTRLIARDRPEQTQPDYSIAGA